VEDDLVVGRSLCRALAALRPDFNVELATSGEAALHELRSASYDVVVTDLDMGRVSGSALLQTLAREFPKVVRIVHSSRMEASLENELRLLIHAALLKPADPAALVRAIASELSKGAP
jgi:two-component system response regulator YesN